MKSKKKNSDERNDPLAGELNFKEMEVVAYGPGWKKVPNRRHSPKLVKQARSKLTRKRTPAKSSRPRAA